MRIAELVKSAEYVVDVEGNKKAVLLDVALWEELLALLEHVAEPEAPQAATNISRRNQKALALLQAYDAELDDKDEAWWGAFEADLRENHLTLREFEFDD